MSVTSITAVAPPAEPTPVATPSRTRRAVWWLVALWILSGVYIVAADQQAVVTRFGRVVERRVMPGIHYAMPWPVDSVARLKVQQMQRLIVGGEAAEGALGRSDPRTSQFLTGDQNLIGLRVAVQYSIGSPTEYLFATQDVTRVVGAAVESELARNVARHGVDAILTTEKAAVQEKVRTAAQRIVGDYKAGVLLSTVSIESATPPPEARDAFNDVASARADSARIVNESMGYANDLIPKARGEAQSMMESAAGYKQKKINEAVGDASRFTQVASEYERAADVNGRRLYMETMEQIMPRIRKLIVDDRGNLDLTILRRGEKSQ